MDLFSKITRVANAMLDEIDKPESFVKGDEFENYLRASLFVKERYDLIQKTHDYETNKSDFVENTKEPDFKFRSIKSGEEFFVEAKYRSDYYENAIEWCKPSQLKRYTEINKKTPVYIAVGVGNKPNLPGHVFFIPLVDIKYTKLFQSFLRDYEVSVNSPLDHRLITNDGNSAVKAIHTQGAKLPVKPSHLQNGKSGFCIRCGKEIKLNPMVPYCGICYKSWKKLSDDWFQEKYCHICKKTTKSARMKPSCYDCYKINKNKLEFPEKQES